MKIPIGSIAAWIGRAVISALVSEAADRLSRPKPGHDRREPPVEDNAAGDRHLDRE